MSNEYGGDLITMTDENGEEFTLELVETIDYNGNQVTVKL